MPTNLPVIVNDSSKVQTRLHDDLVENIKNEFKELNSAVVETKSSIKELSKINSKGFKDTIKSLKAGFVTIETKKEKKTEIGGILKTILDPIKSIMNSIGASLKSIGGGIKNFFAKMVGKKHKEREDELERNREKKDSGFDMSKFKDSKFAQASTSFLGTLAKLGGLILVATHWDEIVDGLGVVLTSIGEVFSKVYKTAESIFISVTEWFKESETAQAVLLPIFDLIREHIGEIVVGFVAFSVATGAIASIIGTIKAVSTALMATKGALVLFTPIVLKIGAVVGVIYAVFESIKDAMEAWEKSSGNLYEAIATFFSSLVGSILNFFKGVVGWVAGAFGFEEFEATLKEIDFKVIIKQGLDAVADWLIGIKNGVLDWLSESVNGILEAFSVENILEISHWLSERASEMLSEAKRFVVDLNNKILRLPSLIFNKFVDLVQGVVDGFGFDINLRTEAERIFAPVTKIFSFISDSVTDLLEKIKEWMRNHLKNLPVIGKLFKDEEEKLKDKEDAISRSSPKPVAVGNPFLNAYKNIPTIEEAEKIRETLKNITDESVRNNAMNAIQMRIDNLSSGGMSGVVVDRASREQESKGSKVVVINGGSSSNINNTQQTNIVNESKVVLSPSASVEPYHRGYSPAWAP